MKKCNALHYVLFLVGVFLLCTPAHAQTINWNDTHQTIDGFGVAESFQVASTMTNAQADTLFSTSTGAGFSLFRAAIPAGYDGDCSSVSTSCASVYLSDMQLATARGAKIWADAFSPPASMKTNGSYNCSDGAGNGALLPSSYGAYAQWIKNFATSLKNLGINPVVLAIQNEPDVCAGSPSTVYTGATFHDFILNSLGPIMASTGVPIGFPEPVSPIGCNGPTSTLPAFADPTINDAAASTFVGYVMTHDYCSNNPTSYTNGNKHFWMSETSSPNTTFDPSIADGLYWAQDIHNWMTTTNVNGWNWWSWLDIYDPRLNDALFERGSFTVAKRLWTSGNFARFVRPGWIRFGTISCPSGVFCSSYRDPATGNFAIVAINSNGSPVNVTFTLSNFPAVASVLSYLTDASNNLTQQFTIGVSGSSLPVTLAASSVTTYTGLASGGGGGGGGNRADISFSQSGGGFMDGTSCGNAEPLSFFTNPANWNGTNAIAPGTTNHLCGTFNVPAGGSLFSVLGSGTPTNPITIKFETGARLQTTYCNVAGNSSGCIILSTPANPRSYIVLDGGTPCGTTNPNNCNGQIVSTTNGTGLATQQTTNGVEAENCTGCEIKNLGIFGQYIHIINQDPSFNVQATFCIFFSGSNFKLHDNAFDNSGWCLIDSYVNGETGVEVYNNELAHMAHGFVYSGGGPVSSNNLRFHNNHMHLFNNWDYMTPACPYHVTGFHAFGTNGGVGIWPNPTNLYIYDNLWDGTPPACATGDVFLEGNPPTGSNTPWSESGTAFYFNNVNSGYVGIFSGGGSGTPTHDLIVNNTFQDGLQIGQFSTYTVENNGYGGGSALYSDSRSTSGGTGNFNAYVNCSGFGCLDGWGVTATSSISAYLANIPGQEQQSAFGAQLSMGIDGTLGTNAGYVPQPGSILISLGANLTSLCSGNLTALCVDKGGVARPSSGAWDSGAYQHTGAVQLPNAPTGLSVISIN